MHTYYTSKRLDEHDFGRAIERVTMALQAGGFGVLTTIDVKATLKAKIGVDFPDYTILGACNPPLAHQALLAEEHIGLMLPCNVVVHTLGDGAIEVSAVDPVASMQAVDNPKLGEIAGEVRGRLAKVIEAV